jgi:hypothetical protein
VHAAQPASVVVVPERQLLRICNRDCRLICVCLRRRQTPTGRAARDKDAAALVCGGAVIFTREEGSDVGRKQIQQASRVADRDSLLMAPKGDKICDSPERRQTSMDRVMPPFHCHRRPFDQAPPSSWNLGVFSPSLSPRQHELSCSAPSSLLFIQTLHGFHSPAFRLPGLVF